MSICQWPDCIRQPTTEAPGSNVCSGSAIGFSIQHGEIMHCSELTGLVKNIRRSRSYSGQFSESSLLRVSGSIKAHINSVNLAPSDNGLPSTTAS